MSAVYPSAVEAFLTGDIDLDTAVIKAQLVSASYVYDATHSTTADLAGLISLAETVTITATTDGTVTCDPITFEMVTGATVTGLVFYVDATDALVCHIDRQADTIPIAVVPDGGDLTFTFARLCKL